MKSDQRKDEIARRLKQARLLAGLSQGQAAKLLEVHRPTISEIEAGRRRVPADELTAMAHIYGVSATWLIGEEEPIADNALLLAARQVDRMSPEDLDRLMGVIIAIRNDP